MCVYFVFLITHVGTR